MKKHQIQTAPAVTINNGFLRKHSPNLKLNFSLHTMHSVFLWQLMQTHAWLSPKYQGVWGAAKFTVGRCCNMMRLKLVWWAWNWSNLTLECSSHNVYGNKRKNQRRLQKHVFFLKLDYFCALVHRKYKSWEVLNLKGNLSRRYESKCIFIKGKDHQWMLWLVCQVNQFKLKRCL